MIRIVVVDDHELVRTGTRRLLEDVDGFNIVGEAASGEAATEALEKGSFDVVLMDVQMPIMDGMQATAAIREIEETAGGHVPIIAMTAHAMRGDREACLRTGMDAYIAKPLDAELLLKLVERLAREESSMDGTGENLNDRIALSAKSKTEMTDPDSAAADDRGVWQIDVALARLGDDEELLRNMIGYFLEDAPGLREQLSAAINDQNAEEATRLTHSLKGLCANFEATNASQIAERTEAACRDNQLSVASDGLPILDRELKALSTALQVWLDAD